ncbi:MAG TPA: hypothetical protein VKX46_16770, partial [Ktedonobacteraceae bacterium]|nr:hypothetical protein [Ktedonobacteraceae bacterium]
MSASGPFITYLIHKLSDQQDRSMAEVMTALAAELHVSVSTLAKWRNNTGNIKSTLLERLVHIGISQAHLDRAWAKNLLESGNHPDPESVLRRYFSPAQRIRHNLPKRTITYIGRKDEFAAVSERLNDPKTWIVPLIGIPGMGLGSFALDLGWRYVENYEWLP